jgi:hypothetical protein
MNKLHQKHIPSKTTLFFQQKRSSFLQISKKFI